MLVVFILKGRLSPSKNLLQNSRFRRLRVTLRNCWQAPAGILGPGRQRQKIIAKEKSVVQNANLQHVVKNIAKGTTDPRVEFISQAHTQFLIKFQFQNLD